MQRRQRVRGSVTAGVILLAATVLVAADLLAWVQVQHALGHRLARLTGMAAENGWHFETGHSKRGGWPFSATLTISNVRLRGPVDWSGERVIVSVQFRHPRRITVRVSGRQALLLPSIKAAFRLRAASFAVHLPAFSGLHCPVLFQAAGLHVRRLDSDPHEVMSIAALHGTLRWTSQARALTADLFTVAFPHGDGGPGWMIPNAWLEASLSGQRLLLRQAGLRWPNAGLTASGAASREPLPSGDFSLRIAGAGLLLDKLVGLGLLTPVHASALRALSLLIAGAGGGESGGGESGGGESGGGELGGAAAPAAPIELPLTLRAGRLLLGGIPLLHLPAVAW